MAERSGKQLRLATRDTAPSVLRLSFETSLLPSSGLNTVQYHNPNSRNAYCLGNLTPVLRIDLYLQEINTTANKVFRIENTEFQKYMYTYSISRLKDSGNYMYHLVL